MRTHLCFSGLLLLIFIQCSGPKEKIPPPPVTSITGEKIVIYELVPRLFGNVKAGNVPNGTIEENGVGKLEDITDQAIAGIKELGVTHILLIGIPEHATMTDNTAYAIPLDDADVVRGKAGYPEAVKDFYDVNPDQAVDVKNRNLEFERLLNRIHKHDLKMIMSINPTQVARNYYSDVKPGGVDDFGTGDDKTKTFDRNNNFYYLTGQSFQPPKGSPVQTVAFPSRDGKFEESPAKASGKNLFTSTPGVTDAWDVVKLNYGIDYFNNHKSHFDSIPGTWSKMRDILVFWAEKKIDAFHCNDVDEVPVEFWHWAIPQVKAVNPEIIFIGELEGLEFRNYINQGRFDFLIEKTKSLDTLRLLINDKVGSTDILRTLQSRAGVNNKMVHFLEKHDEVRIASSFFCVDPLKALPGMVLSATVDCGPVMIYFGQEVGEPAAGTEGYSGDDGKTTLFDFWGMPEHQKWVNGKKYDGGLLSDQQKALRKFYGNLLAFVGNSSAIKNGGYFDLTKLNIMGKNFSNKVYAFARVFEDDKLIIIANFSPRAEHVKVQLSPEVIEAMKLDQAKSHAGADMLGSAGSVEIANGNFLEMEMPAFGYAILKVN